MSIITKKGAKAFESNLCKYYSIVEDRNKKVYYQYLKETFPSIDELAYLKNDFELSKSTNTSVILRSEEMRQTDEGILVVKEYFDGIPLNDYITNYDFTLPQFINLAIKIVQHLKVLHDKKIIVKEFIAENILINPETTELKICSLGSSSLFAREKLEFEMSYKYFGSLWHLAPEQTGRIGRSLDYRVDFYALGVLYYQCLCKRRPFNYTDSLELIHAHIAKNPIEPSKVIQGLPQVLNDIIIKLMAKNAEDRYQSCDGLITDLNLCLQDWIKHGTIKDFPLGEGDYSSNFKISEKLYGRDTELNLLKQHWQSAIKGTSSIVLVSGYSGIGKTRLINELKKNIIEYNAYFLSGKFDQLARDYPYAAFIQAVTELLNIIQREGEEKLAFWKSEVEKLPENSLTRLCVLIPELKNLLPEDRRILMDIKTSDTSISTGAAFRDFFNILYTKNHPVAFFIDDLQWADTESLSLLEELAMNPQTNQMIIGAYRNNEVDIDHPLTMVMSKIESTKVGDFVNIELKDLNTEDVNALIADSLQMNHSITTQLTDTVFKKTRGNPFFIRQYLERLIDENLISFNNDLKIWEWRLDAINILDVSEYVVDLVMAKLAKVSVNAQNIIKLASCIGAVFDFKTLLSISDYNKLNLTEALWELVAGEFISPIGQWIKYNTIDLSEEYNKIEDSTNYRFRFQHDRIQQGAYSLIPEGEKAVTHYKIGLNLLQDFSERDVEENLFEVVNHLNFGYSLLLNSDERNTIIELNLKAAQKALRNNVIRTAYNYFQQGMTMLEGNQSTAIYKDLLIGMSECEYLLGKYEASEKLFDEAVASADNDFLKADILSRKMALYENTQRHQLAIDTAQQGLKLLGMHLPDDVKQYHVMFELLKVKFILRNKTPEELLNNKPMESKEKALIMKILMNLWGPAYLLQKQNLLAYKILKMVQLSVKYGNSIESALAFAFYGYVSSAQLKDYKGGLEMADLGMKLNVKLNDLSLRSKTIVIAEGCVAHWGRPFDDMLDSMREAYQVGVEHNDIIYAGYAVSFMNRMNFISGKPLIDYHQKSFGYFKFANKINSIISLQQMAAWSRIAIDLMEIQPPEEIFKDMMTEAEQLAIIEDLNTSINLQLPLANYHALKLLYYTIMDDIDAAMSHALKADPLMPAVIGLSEWIIQYYFKTLNLCKKINENSATNSERKLAKENIKLLAKWAVSAPENFKGGHFLCLALVEKNETQKEEFFRQAVNYNTKSSLIYLSGMSYEYLAKFLFKKGDVYNAQKEMQMAVIQYSDWGAVRKVKQLESVHSFLQSTNQTSSKKIDITSNSLDLQSIVSAAQVLSSEVNVEKLMEKMMLILIKNAGAQNAYLVRKVNGAKVIEAQSLIINDHLCELTNQSLYNHPEISSLVIDKVFKTKEPVIIDGSHNSTDIKLEKYFTTVNAYSILCLPILAKGDVAAVIYLDNRISSSVFTQERIEILKMLSSQIAISLENAYLYQDLEDRVLVRTKTIEDQKIQIEIAKKQSDDLLLNILPDKIADELKLNGSCQPRRYDSVTILFTDFEKFTQMSTQLDPEELVKLVDENYKAFDRIMEKYDIEKIKTMGDAYMCVSGLPIPTDDHAYRCVKAAQEIKEFVEQYNKDRAAANLPYCPIRIGLHTGAVVAGVVGYIKFAYDIWGDAVNTASRMQSSSEPGRINISDTTYELIKGQFDCEYRGELEVKNRGNVKMYFVNS